MALICRKARWALLGAGLFAGLVPLAAQDKPADPAPSPPAETKKASLTLSPELKTGDGQSVVIVQGTTTLPSRAVIVARLSLAGATVQDTRATVQDGGVFTIKFGPWRKVVLPGKYDVRVAVTPQFQPPDVKAAVANVQLSTDSATFEVGDAVSARRTLESIKRKMVDVAENYRRAFLELNQLGSFYKADLQFSVLGANDKDNPPAVHEKQVKSRREKIAKILPSWRDACQVNYTERFKTARFDWKIFREQILATPYPEAEQQLELLGRAIEAWYKSIARAIYKLAEATPPAEVTEGTVLDVRQCESQVKEAATGFFNGLEYKVIPSFSLNDLSGLEKGLIDGNWYRSFVTKFSIRKPADWLFLLMGNKPTMRVRMTPPEIADAKQKSDVVLGVEIFDFANARDFKHLTEMAKEFNRSRWRGITEISCKEIKGVDPTMPGGERPGLDTEFTVKEGAYVLHGRYYELFCRWHKRTYGVICLAPEGPKWEENKVTFAQTVRTFRVLDAPEYRDMKEDEITRQLELEKRTGKQDKWLRGDDEAKEEGTPPKKDK